MRLRMRDRMCFDVEQAALAGADAMRTSTGLPVRGGAGKRETPCCSPRNDDEARLTDRSRRSSRSPRSRRRSSFRTSTRWRCRTTRRHPPSPAAWPTAPLPWPRRRHRTTATPTGTLRRAAPPAALSATHVRRSCRQPPPCPSSRRMTSRCSARRRHHRARSRSASALPALHPSSPEGLRSIRS